MAVKVTELVGNSFRLKKNVLAHEGRPNSGNTRLWKAGRKTPLIYSWVELENGQIWWQFGRQDPAIYVKHNSAALDPVAERGAAGHLSEDYGGDKGTEAGSAGIWNSLGLTAANFQTVFKWLAYLIAFLIGWQIYGILNK